MQKPKSCKTFNKEAKKSTDCSIKTQNASLMNGKQHVQKSTTSLQPQLWKKCIIGDGFKNMDAIYYLGLYYFVPGPAN